MDYTYDSFSQCIFNPLAKDLFKAYPNLKTLIADKPSLTDKEWDKVLRYVIAAYDHNSPLINNSSTLQARKYQAAKIAGYDLVKEDAFLNELYDCKQDRIVEVITEYLRLFGNSMLWAMIVTQTELFWEFCRNISSPIKEGSDKDIVSAVNGKSKMSEDLMKIHERINSLTKQFYSDDTLEQEVKKLRLTPENMAKLKAV